MCAWRVCGCYYMYVSMTVIFTWIQSSFSSAVLKSKEKLMRYFYLNKKIQIITMSQYSVCSEVYVAQIMKECSFLSLQR